MIKHAQSNPKRAGLNQSLDGFTAQRVGLKQSSALFNTPVSTRIHSFYLSVRSLFCVEAAPWENARRSRPNQDLRRSNLKSAPCLILSEEFRWELTLVFANRVLSWSTNQLPIARGSFKRLLRVTRAL